MHCITIYQLGLWSAKCSSKELISNKLIRNKFKIRTLYFCLIVGLISTTTALNLKQPDSEIFKILLFDFQ